MDERLSPGGEDGVGRVAAKGGDVGADADEGDALLGDVARGLGELGGGLGEGVAGDEAAAVLGDADLDGADGEGAKVLVVVVVVVDRLGVGRVEVDAEGGEVGEEGGHDGLDLGGGLVVGGDGGDHEEVGGEVVDHHGAGVDHGGEGGVEGVDALVEGLGGVVGGEEGDGGTADVAVGEGLEGDADDDAVVARATTGESPVEVRVSGTGRGEELARGGDDLPLEGVIGGETERCAQGGVTTTLCIATSRANSRTFTTDNDLVDLEAFVEEVKALDTGSDLDGSTLVVLVIVVLPLNALHLVGPDRQSTGTGRPGKVVMTSVADDEADVLSPGKVDGSNDVLSSLSSDCISDIVAQCARLALSSEGVTALVGKERGHDGSRVIHAARGVSSVSSTVDVGRSTY